MTASKMKAMKEIHDWWQQALEFLEDWSVLAEQDSWKIINRSKING